jgi:hypothetical protein
MQHYVLDIVWKDYILAMFIGYVNSSGVLFDCENGIPTTEKAIGRYKVAVAIISGSPPPKRSLKRKKPKESGTHYNF